MLDFPTSLHVPARWALEGWRAVARTVPQTFTSAMRVNSPSLDSGDPLRWAAATVSRRRVCACAQPDPRANHLPGSRLRPSLLPPPTHAFQLLHLNPSARQPITVIPMRLLHAKLPPIPMRQRTLLVLLSLTRPGGPALPAEPLPASRALQVRAAGVVDVRGLAGRARREGERGIARWPGKSGRGGGLAGSRRTFVRSVRVGCMWCMLVLRRIGI